MYNFLSYKTIFPVLLSIVLKCSYLSVSQYMVVSETNLLSLIIVKKLQYLNLYNY